MSQNQFPGPDVAAAAQALIARAKRALALHQAGDHRAAETEFRAVIDRVQHVGLYVGFASLLTHTGRGGEAAVWLRRAVALAPAHGDALDLLGGRALVAGRLDEAETWLRRRLILPGAAANTAANLGVVLTRRGAMADALEWCRAACQAEPDNADYHYNLAVAREAANQDAEGLAAYRRALALQPDHRAALDNAGLAATRLGDAAAALGFYRQLSRCAPDDAEAVFWRGNLRLALGDWRGGWQDLEARRKVPRLIPPPPVGAAATAALWDGAPAPGRRLLLTVEQGAGDALMFFRFVALAAARVGSVAVQAHARLVPLLTGQTPGVTVTPPGAPCRADLWLPMMSLPHALGLDVGDLPRQPYIAAPAGLTASWRRLAAGGLSPDHPRRFGLIWAGNANYLFDRHRSPGWRAVRPLLDVPGWTPVLLQYGDGREALAEEPPPPHVVDAGPEQTGFADAAALIDLLDLVITSDTAVAHLAGAMGRETWLMAPLHADWRWVAGDDGRSLWYPSIRLFRQRRLGDWGDVVARISAALREKV